MSITKMQSNYAMSVYEAQMRAYRDEMQRAYNIPPAMAADIQPTVPVTEPPKGDYIELFHIEPMKDMVGHEIVSVFLPLGAAEGPFATFQLTLPVYRNREDAETAMQKLYRGSLYERVMNAIENLIDMAFRSGVGGEAEKNLHNALLDYKAEIGK